jgi:hypothetical protein
MALLASEATGMNPESTASAVRTTKRMACGKVAGKTRGRSTSHTRHPCINLGFDSLGRGGIAIQDCYRSMISDVTNDGPKLG